mmetsp:Transcript_4410/g.10398  ORF Transcript_4410/g.10398 Transcript_4410/m.10398 type:complete len:198 (+) Transcript_4410:419-1012(+)
MLGLFEHGTFHSEYMLAHPAEAGELIVFVALNSDAAKVSSRQEVHSVLMTLASNTILGQRATPELVHQAATITPLSEHLGTYLGGKTSRDPFVHRRRIFYQPGALTAVVSMLVQGNKEAPWVQCADGITRKVRVVVGPMCDDHLEAAYLANGSPFCTVKVDPLSPSVQQVAKQMSTELLRVQDHEQSVLDDESDEDS